MRDKGPISCLQLLRPAGILFLTSTVFDSLERLLPPFLLSPASCSPELVKRMAESHLSTVKRKTHFPFSLSFAPPSLCSVQLVGRGIISCEANEA